MGRKVCVLGLGYVGFPLLCAIARSGHHECLGFDLSESKISLIQAGKSPIDDIGAQKDLNELGNLIVSLEQDSMVDSDCYIVCVPTPIDEFYNPNLGPVKSAVSIITKYLKKGDIVIIESTINPGICEEIVLPLLETSGLKGGKDFYLGHCPERINPGDTRRNVYNIPRNVGALSSVGCTIIADFYKSFLHAEVNEMETITEAEATKIIENTFRDINIAFVNELAQSFDMMGINLINVINGAKNKPFAYMAHYPGCGVGGHCIAVDPYYLIEKAKQVGFDHEFLKRARSVNNSMPEYTIGKLIHILNTIEKSIKGTKITLLGLSYKANVGDMRESPSLEMIKILEKEYEAEVVVFDPYFPDKNTYTTLDLTLKESEAIILATNHDAFINIPYTDYNNLLVLVDGRNCLNSISFEESKVLYTGIGK